MNIRNAVLSGLLLLSVPLLCAMDRDQRLQMHRDAISGALIRNDKAQVIRYVKVARDRGFSHDELDTAGTVYRLLITHPGFWEKFVKVVLEGKEVGLLVQEWDEGVRELLRFILQNPTVQDGVIANILRYALQENKNLEKSVTLERKRLDVVREERDILQKRLDTARKENVGLRRTLESTTANVEYLVKCLSSSE